MIGHWWLYGRKWLSPPCPLPAKKEIKSLQNRRAPQNLKFSKLLATRHEEKKTLHKKNICGWGGVYTMENKNLRNCTNYIWNHFVFTIFYTESFQVPHEKNHPYLKCQLPPKITIWHTSLHILKNGSTPSPPPSPKGWGRVANYAIRLIYSKQLFSEQTF